MLTKIVADNPVVWGAAHRKHVSLVQIVETLDVGCSLVAIEGLLFENERPNNGTPALPVDIKPAAADTDDTTGSG